MRFYGRPHSQRSPVMWFRSLFGRPRTCAPTGRGRRRPTRKPLLETLEDRCLLSLAPVVNSPFAVGANPQAIVTAHLDGDSYLDLAVANYGSDTVSIWLGDVN